MVNSGISTHQQYAVICRKIKPRLLEVLKNCLNCEYLLIEYLLVSKDDLILQLTKMLNDFISGVLHGHVNPPFLPQAEPYSYFPPIHQADGGTLHIPHGYPYFPASWLKAAAAQSPTLPPGVVWNYNAASASSNNNNNNIGNNGTKHTTVTTTPSPTNSNDNVPSPPAPTSNVNLTGIYYKSLLYSRFLLNILNTLKLVFDSFERT